MQFLLATFPNRRGLWDSGTRLSVLTWASMQLARIRSYGAEDEPMLDLLLER
jgi:hypothetical protein